MRLIKRSFRWTAEEDTLLERLIVREHKTFTEAALHMAAAFKNSKVKFNANSCISRAHRLELGFRKNHERKPYSGSGEPRRAYAEPSPPRLKLPPQPKTTHRYRPLEPARFEVVDGTCQFIQGDNYEKCGKPHDGQTNWCSEHKALCYAPRLQ